MKQFILFLALGISLIGNNFLTPIVLSETKDKAKKNQLPNSNKKIIKQPQIKAYEQIIDQFQLKVNEDSDKDIIEQLQIKVFEYEESKDWINAIKYRKKILNIKKQIFGINHSEIAISLNKIGTLHYHLGQFTEAEAYYQKAIKVNKKVFGVNHPRTAEILNNLGATYESLSEYEKAETLYKQSIEIFKKVYGADNTSTAMVLNSLGKLNSSLGKYEVAKAFYQEALKINKKVFGLNHRNTALYLNNIGAIYFYLGQYKKAEPLYKQSLEIYKKLYGLENFDTARALNNLGNLYDQLSMFKVAEPYYKEALEVNKNVFGIEHPNTAKSLTNLGSLYFSLSQFEKAEPLFKQSLEIFKKIFGIEHPNTALSLNKLGSLYFYLGQYEKAIPLYKESLEISKKVFGIEHPDTITWSNNLASLYSSLGQYEKAELLYKESLEISKKVFGIEHPKTADFLSNLASLYSSLGKYEKAAPLLKQSLSIREKVFGIEHPDTALSQKYLGDYFVSFGLLEIASSHYEKALRVYKKFFGNDHPRTVKLSSDLGLLYQVLGQDERGNKLLKSSLIANLRFIKRELPFLSLSSRRQFADLYQFSPILFSKINNHKSNKEIALLSILNSRGLLEEVEKRQSQLKSLEGPQREIVDQIRIINQKISNLEFDQNQISDFLKDKERLEKKLYRLLPALKSRLVNFEDLTKVMKDDSILVEYVRYTPIINSESKASRYIALVLEPSKKEFEKNSNSSKYKIHAIDLGLAKILENKIKNALIATEEGLPDAGKLLKDIGNIIIKPIAAVTKENKTWFITPDGELNKIPFAALGGYEGNNLLVDQIKIRLLTSGRELINLQENRKVKPNIPLVVANPFFDLEMEILSEPKKMKPFSKSNSAQIRSNDFVSFKWAPLPGTAKEGKIIANMINARLLVEGKATVKEVISKKNPEILHIASHSYYLKNQKNNIESLNNKLISQNSIPLFYFAKNENPLLRSGVVLAGANNPDSFQEDDGYLTALEITQLDWSGTELVVISGCESGLGDINNGEGIYGLKRAISVAGAKSSLLSLWKVDDDATAVFMKSFYERLVSGEGKNEALINTQREFRNHKNKNYRHPYIWAAFQLSGDWEPLNF